MGTIWVLENKGLIDAIFPLFAGLNITFWNTNLGLFI